jgi:hypothetical protein
MKKLLVLAAFLGLGYVGVNAQTVAPKKETPKSKVVSNETKPASTTPVVMEDALPAEKAEKKSCAPSDKKECGSGTSKKKSCCSTKKESTTPAPQN